jgi:16S rRNA (adenine1518-N6/adenine1519-N6)-dimethyltransferase
MVKPKKSLGQHFLKDLEIAENIAKLLDIDSFNTDVLEIGPGTGVLTQFVLALYSNSYVIEIDTESVEYLKKNFSLLSDNQRIIEGDFLEYDLEKKIKNNLAIIGNFPYNISSQIFFKILQHKNQVSQVVCMLQKEVAVRIASKEGNKDYGILSVLLQAYYDISYQFTVDEHVFLPPPKVKSGVIKLKRNSVEKLDCDEKLFFRVVKAGFNQRRKTLRNALKEFIKTDEFKADPMLDKRAEQLSVQSFVALTQKIQAQELNKS